MTKFRELFAGWIEWYLFGTDQPDVELVDPNGVTMAVFPHCDARILHAPGECRFCDERDDLQALRRAWGIANSGHAPTADRPLPCPADAAVTRGARGDYNRWGGNVATADRAMYP
jgi:hypothetical protein